jgi:hypothetical protein
MVAGSKACSEGSKGSKARSKRSEGSKAHSKEWSRAQRRARKAVGLGNALP